MMKKHPLRFILIIMILFLVVHEVHALSNGLTQPGSGITILHSDESGLLINLATPNYNTSPMELESGLYQSLTIQGFDLTTSPGKPQVPVISALLGVPPGASIDIRVIADEIRSIPGGYDLPPSGMPASLVEDLQPGGWTYQKDLDIYSRDAYYPEQVVHISSDAWFRDQRVARIEYTPIQYNPIRRSLIWHQNMRVEIKFRGGDDLITDWEGTGKNPRAQPLEQDDDLVLQGTLLNYDQARYWRSSTYDAGEKYQSTLNLTSVSGPRYQIVVEQDGIYRLTYSDLQAAGMDVDHIDPRTFRVTNQGREVAIYVSGEGNGKFENGEYIAFYGQKFDGNYLSGLHSTENSNWYAYAQQQTDGYFVEWHPQFNATMVEKYTNENVYWLTVGGTAGSRMVEVNGDPTGSVADTPHQYKKTIRTEPTERWWSWHFLTEDTWFSQRLQGPGTFSYTATLTALASEPFSATVRGQFAGVTSNNNTSPDHHTRVKLNDRLDALDEGLWDGKSMYSFEASIPQSDLREGVNRLDFIALFDTGVFPTLIYPDYFFDWFEIDYQRLFKAEANELSFPIETSGTWKYEIGGFTSPGDEVYDISDPLSPKRVTNAIGSGGGGIYTATVAITDTAGSQYYVLAAPAIKTPKSLTYYVPPDLRSGTNGADYLIIAHPNFISGVQRLADYRASQGLRMKVVDVDDIYNEFNEGILHPIAIKNFIKYTFYNWEPPAPRYVLLVGDGHLNIKGYNPTWYGNQTWFIPPNLAWVDPWQGEVDATNLLATVVGDDPMPDLSIGRFLVNNVNELNQIIDKIIAYETPVFQGWKRDLLFVSDNPDGSGDYENSAESVINNYIPGSFSVDRIYLGEYQANGSCGGGPTCPAVNKAISDTLSITGTVLLDYNGHGSIKRWAHEEIWTNNDISILHNNGKYPIILSMTCLDGFWFGPTLNGPFPASSLGPSIMEEMVRAPGKGATSSFSAGGLGVATGHDALQGGFYGAVFRSGVRKLGPATLAAKLRLFSTGSSYDLLNTFTIIGDPALKIALWEKVFLPVLGR